MNIIPTNSRETVDWRYQEDQDAYIKGKSDAQEKLPRQGDVYYSDRRTIDCYNMGYSSGTR